jgi:hypothetical protein
MLLFKGYITVFLYSICTLAQLGSITIFTQPAYIQQRDCVKLCFFCMTSCPTVWGAVGCAEALIDDCVCRNDLWSIASSFFTTCISTRCGTTVTNDLASALSLYNGYCHIDSTTLQNDILPQSKTVVAKTTTQVSDPTLKATSSAVASTLAPFTTSNFQSASISNLQSTSTPNPQSTSTLTSANTETPGHSNVGPIVGGAVAGVVAIGIVAIIITMLILRERRRRREQHLVPQPAMRTSQKLFSQPVVVATANAGTVPVDRAEGRGAGEQELDGRAEMGPELEGWGSHRPRWNIPEMGGTSRS